MSWMDSWSRPSKHAAVPPPLYLTAGEDVPYCHTCGRVMSSRKLNKNSNTVKYCSDRCRTRKPGPVDRRIEQAIVALLEGRDDSGLEKTGAKTRYVKGDHRNIVTCDEIEEIVFGSRADPAKVYGRRKNRASRAIGGPDSEWKSVDMEDSETSDSSDEHVTEQVKPGPKIRPPQTESDVNFSVGGERGKAERIEESAEDFGKKQEGQKKAEEREMVRRAARRAVVFGFVTENPGPETEAPSKRSKNKDATAHGDGKDAQPYRRKCEALMSGSIVEPSFAKGNWSIRWRE